MSNKLRQVTDSIHGTIYLSELESEFISTPFFYRLHDVYQSSTVYMTYPSNRTKRYEHSLGTMEIASNILFSAVSNSDPVTRKSFFEELWRFFNEIYTHLLSYHNSSAPYIHKMENELDRLFESIGNNEEADVEDFLRKELRTTYQRGTVDDPALDQFQYSSLSTTQDRNYSGIRDSFLYRCVLEAIRIVALFHDVGHPPYSHVVEAAINSTYQEVLQNENKYDTNKVEHFKKCLRPYICKEQEFAYHCKMMLSDSSLLTAHTHERIGLALLQSAINEVIPGQIKEIERTELSSEEKKVKAIFFVAVVEIAVAILTEKSPFFESLHRIVDGYVDADRLDYIVRDSSNSGVDWGMVPYKRLIQACKLFLLHDVCLENHSSGPENEEQEVPEKYFAIAYPKKNADDITDMLVTRYKIFARINFHHRCLKTAAALKACVQDLSLDYLSPGSNICEEIKSLWESLDHGKAGNPEIRIIQWNDSWLISVLHKALISLYQKSKGHDFLRQNLEEILLNKKRYYSLIKRGNDEYDLAKKVIMEMKLKKESISKLREEEEKKLTSANAKAQNEQTEKSTEQMDGSDYADLFTEAGNAIDSIARLDLLSKLEQIGDLSLLEILLPLFPMTLESELKKTLENYKKDKTISGYQIYINEGREKTGTPKNESIEDNIFLYQNNHFERYNENQSLRGQIIAIQNCVPSINLYFIPEDPNKADEIGKKILDATAKVLGSDYAARGKELFRI